MRNVRGGEFGRVTYWSQTLRSLETMDASEIYSKRLNAKGVIFPKEEGDFIFPIADGRIQPLGGDQELRTSTSMRQRSIGGEGHVDFLGESEGSLPPLMTRFRMPVKRWMSFGPCPCSTEVHWRFQNYTYEFGCQAGETHRRLLEHRWVKRFVCFLDRFHSIYSIGRKPPDGYMCQEGDKRENSWHPGQILYVQNSGRNWQEMPRWRRGKSGHVKHLNSTTLENCEEFISLTLRTRNLRRPLGMLARNWKHQLLLLCLVRHARTITIVEWR